jgi:hypothetical protein
VAEWLAERGVHWTAQLCSTGSRSLHRSINTPHGRTATRWAIDKTQVKVARVGHVGVTCHPTDAGVAQQVREATPVGPHPTSMIRANDSTFGPDVARVARDSGSELLGTAYQAPRMPAVGARFLESVRRKCRAHLLILSADPLRRALRASGAFFNTQRPHQGIAQQVPLQGDTSPRRGCRQGA